MAGVGSGHRPGAANSRYSLDSQASPRVPQQVEVMKNFRGRGGETFSTFVESMPNGSSLLARPSVVLYERPIRVVPTSNEDVTDAMLTLVKLERAQLSQFGFGTVAALLMAARADGKLTLDDVANDRAAVEASTQTTAGMSESGVTNLKGALKKWCSFYDACGIDFRIARGDFGAGFSLGNQGPTSVMAEEFVTYLMCNSREKYDWQNPDFHGMRCNTIASLLSLLCAQGFGMLFPRSDWSDNEKRKKLSESFHADANRAAGQQRRAWVACDETRNLDAVYTHSCAKRGFSKRSWNALCDQAVKHGVLGIHMAALFSAIVAAGNRPGAFLKCSDSRTDDLWLGRIKVRVQDVIFDQGEHEYEPAETEVTSAAIAAEQRTLNADAAADAEVRFSTIAAEEVARTETTTDPELIRTSLKRRWRAARVGPFDGFRAPACA
jgi:hypothetical protein